MAVVTIDSTFTAKIALPSAQWSRSTTTINIGSTTSRYLIVFMGYGNISGVTNPQSGNSLPMFGNVAMSEITRPTGGNIALQSMNWIAPISDASSGDYEFVMIKSQAADCMEVQGFLVSQMSSVYSSVVSTNLSTGPCGLIPGPLIPTSVASDMIIGMMISGSGITVVHTQTGEGNPVYSNLTPGGSGTGAGIPALSTVTMQGDSSVSLLWTIPDSQRWRVQALILYPAVATGGGGGGGSGAGGWIQPSSTTWALKDPVQAWSSGV